ncbi:MAG: hypothetical protein FD160_4047, partial [Caulobacteraceae bacterium]
MRVAVADDPNVGHNRRADTLRAQIDAFVQYLSVERRQAPLTVATYARDLEAMHRFAQSQKLPLDAARLDREALRHYLAATAHDSGPATISRRISALRAFYRFLAKRRLCTDNPAAALRLPKVAKPLPKFLSVDAAFEVVTTPHDDAYAEALAARDRAILEVLYGSGLRVGELCGLSLDAIELAERAARVLGKGGRERVVPLGGATVTALAQYLQARACLRHPRKGTQHPSALFLGQQGTRLSPRQVQYLVQR